MTLNPDKIFDMSLACHAEKVMYWQKLYFFMKVVRVAEALHKSGA